MPAIHETAYPRIRSSVTDQELHAVYTPTPQELTWAHTHTKAAGATLGLLVLLKTCQRLGYFPALGAVPQRIIAHISHTAGFHAIPRSLAHYEPRGFRWKHMPIIRRYLQIHAFSDGGTRVMLQTLWKAAQTRDILADLINAGIEALVQSRYELPAFQTLHRAAEKVRSRVNRRLYHQVTAALAADHIVMLDNLLTRAEDETTSPWHRLKQEPKQPTPKRVREGITHLRWLHELNAARHVFDEIPESKLRRLADEARSLNAAEMKAIQDPKRWTLAVALIRVQTANALDDLADMFLRRMTKLHQGGREALAAYHTQHQDRTDTLIGYLSHILTIWQSSQTPEQRLEALDTLLKDQAEQLVTQCDTHLGYADNNYLPFLPRLYRSQRNSFYDCLELLHPQSTSTDIALQDAIAFLLQHRHSRAQELAVVQQRTDEHQQVRETPLVDLSWIPPHWWTCVTGMTPRNVPVRTVHRKYFELCLFSCVMLELKSGDLWIEGSERFSDYRQQLVSWDEYHAQIETFCQQVGHPADPGAFVQHIHTWLTSTIRSIDEAFPANPTVSLQEGRPVMRKPRPHPVPAGFAAIERHLTDRLGERNILDVLSDTEHWLHWTAPFGPISGFDARLDEPRIRYLATAFCYGCHLGPTQTARSMTGIDGRHLAYVNQKHVTAQTLLNANVQVINAYNRFTLPKLWGSGQHASADGTKWDVYEQNLLSEYHIRYGGWGGIGYYHVSDTYIALFSSFISCGVWEAVHILDGLLENRSEIRPDTLHADTQGQSEPVFGLAYLLGIQLMPRIRHWQALKFYLPSTETPVKHLHDLFTDTIDWPLIQTHLPDMLRVALSISQGTIRASTILHKLGTYSRKNRLYLAFRELGRLVRTVFLLQLIGDEALRRTILTATNTSESWNAFIQWIAFGGQGIIKENNREEQRKIIRYNHLIANLVIFYNVVTMTQILRELVDEGYPITPEILARLSPYKTEHINRFGQYELRFDQIPQPITEDLSLH